MTDAPIIRDVIKNYVYNGEPCQTCKFWQRLSQGAEQAKVNVMRRLIQEENLNSQLTQENEKLHDELKDKDIEIDKLRNQLFWAKERAKERSKKKIKKQERENTNEEQRMIHERDASEQLEKSQ